MKTFRTLALIASVVIGMIATIAPARADTGTATLISVRDGTASQVVATDVTKLTDFLGTRLTLDVKAFGGLTFAGGKLTGGLAVSHRRPISREWSADVGLFGRFVAGRPADGGLFLGFGRRL